MAAASSSPPPLLFLSALLPVRSVLHSLWDDGEAARALRLSRSTAALLLGYTFYDHVFVTHQPQRLLDLCDAYHLHLTKLQLANFERGFDERLLPLTAGEVKTLEDEESDASASSCASASTTPSSAVLWYPRIDQSPPFRRARPIVGWTTSMTEYWEEHFTSQAYRYGYNMHYPCRMRVVPLNYIPGQEHSEPQAWIIMYGGGHRVIKDEGGVRLSVHRSITHLRLNAVYDQPLLPQSLPPRLQYLHLGQVYNRPLPPGVIPSSVRVLQMGQLFNQPLQVGSIPEGVVFLELSFFYAQPLLPGVLPITLRFLAMSSSYEHPLPPGVLPASLEALWLPERRKRKLLQPGSIDRKRVKVIYADA